MSAENVVVTIERFFLDLVGTVVPGGLLLSGVWLVLRRPDVPLVSIPPRDVATWTFLLVFSYVLGHLVSSAGRFVVEAPVGWAGSWIRSRRVKRSEKGEAKIGGLLRYMISTATLEEDIAAGAEFKEFARGAAPHFPRVFGGDGSQLHAARDIAISLAPRPAQIFRFRFLSLLNFGVATAILSTLVIWTILAIPGLSGRLGVELEPLAGGWMVVWAGVSLFFIERGFYFRSITMRVPFSMGAVALHEAAVERRKRAGATDGDKDGELSLYLAGGFRSGWQERVPLAWGGRVVDPRKHQLQQEDAYTLWDLEAVGSSDWVLAYLEETNPAGYALALEVGFAKALGKKIILVDEKSRGDSEAKRYLAMLRAASDVVFESLEDALEFLRTWNPPRPRRED